MKRITFLLFTLLALGAQAQNIHIALTVDSDAEIWVNEQKKGVRSWGGWLAPDAYVFETKKVGCENGLIVKEITPDMDGQTITLPAPKPISGSLNVVSTPSGAKVYLDNKEMGTTPLNIPELLVNTYTLRIALKDYTDYSETFTIVKGERKQVNATLEKKRSKDENYVSSVDQRRWNLIYSQRANERKYCNGVYGNGAEGFSANVGINRNNFRIVFSFEAMESTKPQGQYALVLSHGWRVLGVQLTNAGDINITTNNQRNTYPTGITYTMGESKQIDIEYNNGEMIVNGVRIPNVEIDRTSGDNNLSSTNFSNGMAFHGYIKNVRVYNRK